MNLFFLGTGCAVGVPAFRCECAACERSRKDPSWRRASTCCVLECAGQRLLLDAGVDQLASRFPDYDALLLTHFHEDHMVGLTQLRLASPAKLEVYCPPDPVGYGTLFQKPIALQFKPVQPLASVAVGPLAVTAVPLNHVPFTHGYCVEGEGMRITYLTDTCGLPEETWRFMGLWRPDIVVIESTFQPYPNPQGHNSIETALETIERLKPQAAFLTHVNHHLDAWMMETGFALPANVYMARDGVNAEISKSAVRVV